MVCWQIKDIYICTTINYRKKITNTDTPHVFVVLPVGLPFVLKREQVATQAYVFDKYRHTTCVCRLTCRFAICTWGGHEGLRLSLNLQHPKHIILQLKQVRHVCYNHLPCEVSNLHMDYTVIRASDLDLCLQDVVSEYKLHYCNAKLLFGTWVFKMCKKNESRNKVVCLLVSITHAYTGWPKKVSHYQINNQKIVLNRIKTCEWDKIYSLT